MTYSQVVEITSDNQNAVEQVINTLRKESQEAQRYGVDISIRRVDVSDKDVNGFQE